jgi:hypothetical protein
MGEQFILMMNEINLFFIFDATTSYALASKRNFNLNSSVFVGIF